MPARKVPKNIFRGYLKHALRCACWSGRQWALADMLEEASEEPCDDLRAQAAEFWAMAERVRVDLNEMKAVYPQLAHPIETSRAIATMHKIIQQICER